MSDDFKFIAEIGLNHNGDVDIAKKLIKHACDCRCDIVKFQKRTPDICVPEHQKNIMKYDTPWGDITYLDYRHKVEFGLKEYDIIDEYCRYLDIDWTASVWDLKSVDFINNNYDLKYNKIPSPMLTNIELLEQVASYGRYTFISTGMSNIEDIDKAVNVFRFYGCPFELMHTVSIYPMDNKDANLRVIQTLKDRYGCRVGWSGHEEGLQVSIAAVAMGANSIERHITLSRSMWGSDQAASLGTSGLRQLSRDCRVVKEAMGDGIKRMIPEEEKKRKSLRG
jgi:N-acetylneuraminate synthase